MSKLIAKEGLDILSSFPQVKDTPPARVITEEQINFSLPWDFYDGASHDQVCGGGAILFLREGHSFKITMGLGEDSNNFAELLNLKILIIFATEKGCRTLVCFGDSMNVINWVKKTQVCRHLGLENILISIAELIGSLDSFSCSHVYRENNREADMASKEGLPLM